MIGRFLLEWVCDEASAFRWLPANRTGWGGILQVPGHRPSDWIAAAALPSSRRATRILAPSPSPSGLQ